MFETVLVANRGEIAVRIIRTCHDMGIRTVCVYSTADRDGMARHLADDAICIGPPPALKSYLSIPNIISAALMAGADAVHPGTGFLAENGDFAEVCRNYGVCFVGPDPDVLRIVGDKTATRLAMQRAGLRVLPGSDAPVRTLHQARGEARRIGYPVMIKAAEGGGGRGMRVVEDDADLERLFVMAQAEAMASFSSDKLLLEQYVRGARHIEVQILADGQGGAIHLGERNCSLQRRYQKLLEEAPSPGLPAEARARICTAAVVGARALGYQGAGTFEFLVDDQHQEYFLEVNGRLQVEHPVTEMITGVDLVREQLSIAAGNGLDLSQDEVSFSGHAIECRINAEDPSRGFAPDAGTVATFWPPGGYGVRVDSHLYSGAAVPPHYDSLLAKIITHGADRDECIRRMLRALDECRIDGVKTNRSLHQLVLQSQAFRDGAIDTGYLQEHLA